MSSCDHATRRGGASTSSPSTTVCSPTPRSPAGSYRLYPREAECASLEIPIPCSSPPIPMEDVAIGNPGYLVIGNALICPTGNEKECYGAIPIPMSFNINNDSPDQHKVIYLGNLKRFQFRELQIATNGFSSKNSLCKGGFGNVYKGKLQGRTLVAVKRLDDGNAAGREIQFKAEVEMISLAIHRHILRLCGFCMTTTEKLLVYPYMSNGSVASRLKGTEDFLVRIQLPKSRVVELVAESEVKAGVAEKIVALYLAKKVESATT
ncbi:hypothetical protein ZIOFF_043495 [Zingiber officinale]|uniref:non-specific serine/threonine protein kinase n=1 Tax=Zingiber officinale TaxID=94328 RepID=A0A8J5KU11_ZINOF|nr:hypothetical protein ZIOFF_043495 [Zingiber officinale]